MKKIIKTSKYNSIVESKKNLEKNFFDLVERGSSNIEQIKNMKWHIEFLEQKIREQVEENNEVRAENITLIEKNSAFKSRIKTLEEANAELCSKNDDMGIKINKIKEFIRRHSS